MGDSVSQLLYFVNCLRFTNTTSITHIHTLKPAKSAGAVEYTDCTGGKTPSINECPNMILKKPYGVAPVMLKRWGMQSTLSLQSLPGLL